MVVGELAVVVVAALVVVAAVVVVVSDLKSDSKSNPSFAPNSFPSLMTLSRNVSAHSSWVVLKMLRNESNIDWQKLRSSEIQKINPGILQALLTTHFN